MQQMSQGQNLKSSWAVMVPASDTNIREAAAGGEFKATLVYWLSSRTARAAQGHLVSKNQKKKNSINDFKLILINDLFNFN